MGQSGSSYPLYDLSWPYFDLRGQKTLPKLNFTKCGYFPIKHMQEMWIFSENDQFSYFSMTLGYLTPVDFNLTFWLSNVDICLYLHEKNVDNFKKLINPRILFMTRALLTLGDLNTTLWQVMGSKNPSNIEYNKNENVYSTKSVWARSIKPSLRFRSRFYEL